MIICFFQATDIDLPPNNIIEYFIINGDPEGNFTINTTSGEIGLSGPLDYEKMPASAKGRYTLTVMAKDMGTPVSLNSTVNVIIQVEVGGCISYLSRQVAYVKHVKLVRVKVFNCCTNRPVVCQRLV